MGIVDYQLLDPAHDELGRSFVYVLYIGELPPERMKKLQELSQKAWLLPAPDPTASVASKKVWIESLKKINEYILANQDKVSFKKDDVPPPMMLSDYLNSKTGQVFELRLPDRRRMGIYPDGEKLKMEYDIEYHASTVVNIAKLFEIFDASEIIIKEL